MTVNVIPAISGTSSICVGYSVTLSDALSGGTWSSTVGTVATIGSSTGVLTTSSIGATTISYTVSSVGNCSAVRVENITNIPNVYTVTGGGNFCSGGTGVHVGLSNSDPGIVYQLYNGASTVGAPVTSTGGSLDFGFVTGAGTYNVIANPGTPCSTVMSGGATVVVNSLPTAYSVTGGGNYCVGGSGVHVFLSSSQIGINYQVFNGSAPVGGPVAGTGAAIDFGLFTGTGTYTIVGTNGTTSCTNSMSGNATIGTNPLPASFNVTGGGGYCAGGSGVHIGLSGSATGINYQLMQGSTSVGAPSAGTGSLIDFGVFTSPGTYSVVASNASTSCLATMSGTATVAINALPTAFAVIGGGNYCVGGTGSPIGLAGSTAGVNYQLYVTVGTTTTAVGTAVAGTGSAISFGNQTTVGTYSVVATNATTTCVSNMTGTVAIATNPLPTSFTVTGGGGYCAGGSGVSVGLSGSVGGTTYQLFNGTTLIGAASGTGGPISFGVQTVAGTNYNVVGITAFGCTANMSGSTNVTINSLPNTYLVTGGGNYCAGTTGIAVGLSGSQSGVNYQLYNGTTPLGSATSGSGSSLNFGLQTGAGTYSVVAYNPTTTCSSNMSGTASVGVNPAPVVYAVTGGGAFCASSTGVHVGLASSDAGISYQLMKDGVASGSSMPGIGAALDFGVLTAGGNYTVIGSNTGTSCSSTMGGSATITVNALPGTFTVNGGGNYCSGSAGMPIGLSGSVTGINYQLYVGTTAVGSAVPGTGSAISFGLQTVVGTYNALAINASTGCANNMTGTASIGVLPLPALFAVSGGGSYCSGSTGVHVNLSSSTTGITYQLMNGTAAVGVPMGGTGASLDFGPQTAGGTYTVVASNPLTTCARTMTGSANVVMNSLPLAYNVTGGGDYCSGGVGLHVLV